MSTPAPLADAATEKSYLRRFILAIAAAIVFEAAWAVMIISMIDDAQSLVPIGQIIGRILGGGLGLGLVIGIAACFSKRLWSFSRYLAYCSGVGAALKISAALTAV